MRGFVKVKEDMDAGEKKNQDKGWCLNRKKDDERWSLNKKGKMM